MDQPEVVSPQVDNVTDDDRLWALLSWILTPIVPVIVLLLDDKKGRPFIKYNAIQALILGVVGYILSSVLIPVIGLGCLTGLAVFGYQIYLAIKANSGEWVVVPVLTDFVKNQGWI
ncbi:MAG: hypothetical protein JXA33_18650 [Anaerolineae bacterium]|nr:hypothetical protein [Anaerolineae bacterium]